MGMTTIDRAGNKRGTGAGRPWTENMTFRLCKMVDDGASLNEMADRLGCKKQRVQDRLKRLKISVSKKTEYSQRICLCCREPFPSEGIHNRLCTTCRNRSVCDGRV